MRLGNVLSLSLIFGEIPAWCPYKLCPYKKKECNRSFMCIVQCLSDDSCLYVDLSICVDSSVDSTICPLIHLSIRCFISLSIVFFCRSTDLAVYLLIQWSVYSVVSPSILLRVRIKSEIWKNPKNPDFLKNPDFITSWIFSNLYFALPTYTYVYLSIT